MKKTKILTLGKYIKKKINGKSIYDFLKQKEFNLKHYDEFEKFKSNEKFDIVICYGYGLILSNQQIKKISKKIINLHIGYLPFARGIYPLLWSIIFNKKVGCTIHTIENKEVDTGKLIYRKKINIRSTQTLKDIHRLCLEQINKIFMDKFYILIKKKNLKKIPTCKYYFNKSTSNKLILALPKKWNTKASYLRSNSIKLKNLYKK